MKDMLVDANVAKNFCNPLDLEYKKLITWLFEEGSLVVTTKLLQKYYAATGASSSASNITYIIARQQLDGRLVHVQNRALREYRLPRRCERAMLSNNEDRPLIKAVFLSKRKLALSIDENFCRDVNGCTTSGARAEKRPESLGYWK